MALTDIFPFAEDRFILVGKITKPHGLRGDVKLFSYSDEPETLLRYSQVVLVDNRGSLSPNLAIESARLQGKFAVLKLSTIDDRNSAEAIHGRGVLIEKTDLPPVEDDEYYWYQLYDLPVSTETGTLLGTVSSVFSNGARDIMIVKDQNQEYLIPILDTIIKEQNKEGIIIAPPPGLLEINTGTNE